MSEARDLNESSSPEPGDAEIEQLLRSLVPRPLAVDRDALFFRAGIAAAGQGSNGKRFGKTFWPAIAATLLLACGGLSIVLAQRSAALEAALAVALRATAVASDPASASQRDVEPDRQGGASTHLSDEVTAGDRPHGLGPRDRLEPIFSLDREAEGQLTAHGWVELPVGARGRAPEPTPAPPKAPSRPIEWPIYLELLRSQKG